MFVLLRSLVVIIIEERSEQAKLHLSVSLLKAACAAKSYEL